MGLFDIFKKKKKAEAEVKEESEVKVSNPEESTTEEVKEEVTEETKVENTAAEETKEETESKTDDEVFMANIKVYSDKEGYTFGALVLTEGVLTGLPIDPKSTYKNNEETIEDWKLLLFSTTEDKSLGEIEYYKAIEKLRKYSNEEKDGDLIVRPLTLEEQLGLLED